MFVPCFLWDLEARQLQQHPAKVRKKYYIPHNQLQEMISEERTVKVMVRTGDPGGPGGPRGPSKPLGPCEE